MNFKKSLDKFKSALKLVQGHQIDLSKKTSKFKTLIDFKEKRLSYYTRLYQKSFKEMVEASLELNDLIKVNKENKDIVNKINMSVNELVVYYKNRELDKINNVLSKIEKDYSKLILPIQKEKTTIKLSAIPADIRDDIRADIEELDKCFKSGCYRSCVMLCGRLLETTLHRRYYEVTGNDLLEKSPGIGLGNLIAKLKEKEISFDPGLTQQIHLINQVRIFSVHKKQQVYNPTKAQTHAVILYSLDVLEKMFRK